MDPSTGDATALHDHIAALKRKLLNFSSGPEGKALLRQQQAAQATCHDLQQQLESARNKLASLERLIELRRQAMKNNTQALELAQRQQNRGQRLAKLRQQNTPGVIIQNEERMLWEVTAPITELETYLRVTQETLSQISQEFSRAGSDLAAKQELYRLGKKKVQQDIAAAGERLREVSQIAVPPVISATAIIPPTGAPVTESRRRKKKRHCQIMPAHANGVAKEETAWQFLFTEHENNNGIELSSEPEKFASELHEKLAKEMPARLAKLVYKKLLKVTKLSIQQRQELNKLVDLEPVGGKKIKVSRQCRLFLGIDEASRKIRFMIMPHSVAYAYRRRK